MVEKEAEQNHWVLILGGSSGLGLASAKKLAAHGFNICIVHRDARAKLLDIEKEFDQIRNMGVHCRSFNVDALNEKKRLGLIAELNSMLDETGRIRLLLHSIAKGNLKPMLSEGSPELQNEDFALTINAMALSLYDWTKLLIQHKMFADDARVVSFTSEGNAKVWKNYAAVSAAKSTLESITRGMAVEFAPFGIRANCIQAGVTDTVSFRMIPGSEQIRQHTLSRNPYKRLTTPEDVANVVYLLSKEEASWINGTVITVDGGEHLS
jgi:enoyl-[acyl-carrier protein] reductase III